MRWTQSARNNSIDFEVRLSGDRALEQIGFIYLLSLRHDGRIETTGTTYMSGDRKRFGSVVVKFGNFDDFYAAAAHCGGHLDENGVVHQNYAGALPRADPSGKQAERLYREMGGKPEKPLTSVKAK